jgi:hypothetical protein
LIFCLAYLRTQGEDAGEHDVKHELARAEKYREKVEKFMKSIVIEIFYVF